MDSSNPRKLLACLAGIVLMTIAVITSLIGIKLKYGYLIVPPLIPAFIGLSLYRWGKK